MALKLSEKYPNQMSFYTEMNSVLWLGSIMMVRIQDYYEAKKYQINFASETIWLRAIVR